MLLAIPYIQLFIPALLLTIPFYFLNNFLQKKIKPRENGNRLLLYFIVVIISIFVYITIATFLVIAIAKFLR